MTTTVNQKLIRRVLLSAWLAVAISLSAVGCNKSNPHSIRSNPAPLQFDFPYQVSGFSRVIFGGDNFQMFEGTHLHYIVLAGVDSPQPGQPFYIESRDALVSLLDKQTIELTIIRHDPDYREIGFAFVKAPSANAAPNRLANPTKAKTETNHQVDATADTIGNSPKTFVGSLDVGHEIIRRGLGWYDGNEFAGADLYRAAQEEAQAAKRGLWIRENPDSPWERDVNDK